MRRYILFAVYAFIVLTPVQSYAQKENATEILARVRTSVQQMTNALPSLVCREEVVSTKMERGKVKVKGNFGYQLTVTLPAKPGDEYPEERKLLTYNGKPIHRNKRHTPVFLYLDGFGTTFDGILSPAASRCLLYSAHATSEDGVKILELDVRKNHAALALRVCRIYKEDPDGTASFWISADTGQLLRFYAHMPHVRITWQRGIGIPHSVGLEIKTMPLSNVVTDTDYHSVQFGPALTIIPAKVNVTAILLKKPYIEYTYHAVQSECHRFLATVTLLPVKMVPPEN